MDKTANELFLDALRTRVDKRTYRGDRWDRCLIGQLFIWIQKQPEWEFISPLIQKYYGSSEYFVWGVALYFGVNVDMVTYISHMIGWYPYVTNFDSALEFAEAMVNIS